MRLFLYGITLGSVLLAGCNDSSSTNNASTPAQSDAFSQQAARVISIPEPTAELLEPEDITALVTTSPENTEPMAVSF